MAKRIPDVPRVSKAKSIKSSWKKSKQKISLKTFASNSTDPAIQEANVDWRFNKSSNFSNPPQGIGNTHKVKTKQAKPKDDAAATKK